MMAPSGRLAGVVSILLCFFFLGVCGRATHGAGRELQSLDLDTHKDNLGLSDSINSVSSGEDRSNFVTDLAEHAYYGNGNKQHYNVMVIKLSNHFDWHADDVEYYGEAHYQDDKYGVWAFGDGTWVNYGDGGPSSWCYFGKYQEYNHNGGQAVHFSD